MLHTWGRSLDCHPHIHYIAPGGALSSAKGTWHAYRPDFYLPVKALSKIIRGKFRDELLNHIPKEVWQTDWVVNSQAVGSSEATLKYLAPYVFGVLFTGIISLEDSTVRLHYRKSGSNRWRTPALEVMEFIRRFLQHVLPTGFTKIRYYGFMNTSCTVTLERIGSLIELACGLDLAISESEVEPRRPMLCPKCGGTLKLIFASLPYLYHHFAQSGWSHLLGPDFQLNR